MNYIKVEIDSEGVALLVLDRPEVLNAMHVGLMAEAIEAMQCLSVDDDVRALVVTGSGRAFCAGADLAAVADNPDADENVGERVAAQMQSHFNPFMERLYEFPKPTICAVNGIAAGGGAAVALCADVVLASSSAGLKFVQVQHLGIVADLGANWLLPRIAGRSRAMAACLLGQTIDAAQLLEWGMVLECVEPDELLPRAKELGVQLGRLPAQTVLSTRSLIDEASRESYATLLERERLAQRELCDLPVFMQSVKRFTSA